LACPGEAKKKRRQMPDLEKIGESFVGPSFGAELANMSRAVLKVGNWEVRKRRGRRGGWRKGEWDIDRDWVREMWQQVNGWGGGVRKEKDGKKGEKNLAPRAPLLSLVAGEII
jgi:hypothetical protein